MTDWSTYQKYLKSQRWQAKRNLVFATAGRFCRSCGASYGPMHVHHLTYERLGNEALSDFMVLCKRCHDGLTKDWRARGRSTGMNLREFSLYWVKQAKRGRSRKPRRS